MSHHAVVTHIDTSSPFSRKSVRSLVKCPGPECEECREVRGTHSHAVKIVRSKKLCFMCAKNIERQGRPS